MENQNPRGSLEHGVLLQFIIFVVLVGGAPIAMKVIFSELGPFYLGLIRYGLGALFFWALALNKGLEIPKRRALIGALLYGIFGFGFSFLFLAWGLVETSASLGSILMALLPLLTILLSALQGTESLTRRGVIGALLAVAGIAVSVGGAPSAEISLPRILAMILGTAFLAESNVIIKKYPRNHPIITNAVAMTVSAPILGIASLIFREQWLIPAQLSTWIALGYQILPVTILAFFLYAQVLNKWTASATSYAFVLIPLITVIIAAFFYGEQITTTFIIGATLVLMGVLVGALLPGKTKVVIHTHLEDYVSP
jgi:drug/metabolite transporter (DMT)-like permease